LERDVAERRVVGGSALASEPPGRPLVACGGFAFEARPAAAGWRAVRVARGRLDRIAALCARVPARAWDPPKSPPRPGEGTGQQRESVVRDTATLAPGVPFEHDERHEERRGVRSQRCEREQEQAE